MFFWGDFMGIAYFTKASDPVVVYKNGGFGLNTKNVKVMMNFDRNVRKMKKLALAKKQKS